MSAAVPTKPGAAAPISATRALAHAWLAALAAAHAQPPFTTGRALAIDFDAHFVAAPALVAAAWMYDFAVIGIALSIGALALAALRSEPERARAALLGTLGGLLAGLDLAWRADVPPVVALLAVLGLAGALGAVAARALAVSSAGFAAGACALSIAHAFAAASAPGALASSAFAHAGALAIGAGAAIFAQRAARPLPPHKAGALIAAALAALLAAEWAWLLRAPAAPREALAPRASSGAATGPRPHVVVVVLDTFRADAFDPRPDGATPALAAFARESRVAQSATSTSSWTLPAHASLFTGSYPTTHGAHFLGARASEASGREAATLADENTTLAELLRDAGYATIGVVANAAYLHSDTNIHQGFEVWDDRHVWPWDWPAPLCERIERLAFARPLDRALRALTGLDEALRQHRRKRYRIARDVNAAVEREIDARDAALPLFLFVNYMDAHAPYIPQRETRALLGDALDPRWLDTGDGFGGVDPDGPGGLELMRGERDLTDDERRHLEAAYGGEVRDLDRSLGALFELLRARELYEDAWIVVAADHGEHLGEHRLLGHSSELSDEAVRIPLFVRTPNGADTRPIEGDVQLVDVLPTLARALELAIPAQVEGSAFDELDPARAAVAEQFEYRAFVARFGDRFAGDRRAYRTQDAALFAFTRRAPELFARRDGRVAGALDDASLRDRLLGALARWVEARSPVAGDAAPPPLGDAERQRLEALGYL